MGVCVAKQKIEAQVDLTALKAAPHAEVKPGPPKRERLSIWKLSDGPEQQAPLGAEGFLHLYQNRSNGSFRKNPKINVSHILQTEEKEEQGTVMVHQFMKGSTVALLGTPEQVKIPLLRETPSRIW